MLLNCTECYFVAEASKSYLILIGEDVKIIFSGFGHSANYFFGPDLFTQQTMFWRWLRYRDRCKFTSKNKAQSAHQGGFGTER